MTRVFSTIALVLLVGVVSPACDDDDDSPTNPTDETVTFIASLSPSNEVPPVTGPEATGTGTATIQLRFDRDGDDIDNATADFQVVLGNFPAGTPVVGAHIHSGAAGQNGDIVVNTGITPGEVQLTTGSGSFQETDVSVSSTVAEQMLANPSQFYFNVHSTANPNGFARGQLIRQQ